tara:strand:- start:2968 stop:4686 length:1719 start_codon:yes stop_codon:yes gene_type:complete
MARFSGTALPAATYNPALNTAGQSIAAGISAAGQALGRGVESYIKNKVQKREDEEAAQATADFLWKSGMAERMGVQSREELGKYTKDKQFAQMLKVYEAEQAQQARDQQSEVNALKLDELYRQRDQQALAGQRFTTGGQVRDYINRVGMDHLGQIDLENPQQTEATLAAQAKENPLTSMLQESAGAGASDEELLRKYRAITGQGGGISVVPQKLPDGSTVWYKTDQFGNRTEVVPESSLGKPDQSGWTPVANPVTGRVMHFQETTSEGGTGGKVYVHSKEPGTPLDALGKAVQLKGTSEDTVENVYLRDMMPGEPGSVSQQDLLQMRNEAAQRADADRQGFVGMVNTRMDNSTTNLYVDMVQLGAKTISLLDTAINENNLPAMQGAIKSYISQVEKGIVTDDEFARFSDLGLLSRLESAVDAAGGNVTQEVVDELRTASEGLIEFSVNGLESHIQPVKTQAMETYPKIPAAQAQRLAMSTVDTELDKAKKLLGREELVANRVLPEGARRHMGNTLVTGNSGEKNINDIITPLVGRFTGEREAQLREGLSREYPPPLVDYIVAEIRKVEGQSE